MGDGITMPLVAGIVVGVLVLLLANLGLWMYRRKQDCAHLVMPPVISQSSNLLHGGRAAASRSLLKQGQLVNEARVVASDSLSCLQAADIPWPAF